MLLVLTTVPNETEAENLAEKLVEAKLAACVQVLPKIKSFYYWNNSVQRDEEFLLFIKTTDEKFNSIETFIKAIHNYETPEIISVSVTNASADYAKWVNEYCGIR